MEANEFRIGNYIDWDLNDPRDYEDEFDYGFSECQLQLCDLENPERISPIILKEKWFLKFGFIYNENWNFYYPNDIEFEDIVISKRNLVFRIYHDSVHCYLLINDSMSTPQWQKRLIFIRKINFVHELQNLYFTVAGKELTSSSPQVVN